MKFEKKLAGACFLFSGILVLLITGCLSDGPAGVNGVNGVNGTNGTNGIDANQTCRQCHSNSQTIVAKEREWEQSGHSAIEVGNSFDYAGTRGTCMPCHNGSIYPGYIAGDKDSTHYVNELANAIGPNCRTCHQIHTDYDSTDWALVDSATSPVKLRAKSSVTIDMGMGNLCVKCHQAIGTTNLDTLTADTVKMFARSQAHHGPQVNVVAGIGAYDFTGQTVTTAKPTSAVHLTAVEDGCVECHLSPLAGTNHTFQPKPAACKTCHTTATNFNIASTQTAVSALLTEIQDSLISKGLIIANPASVIGVSVPTATTSLYFKKKYVGAAYNFFVALEDRSKGVHNPAYIKYMLQNSLELLKQ